MSPSVQMVAELSRVVEMGQCIFWMPKPVIKSVARLRAIVGQ